MEKTILRTCDYWDIRFVELTECNNHYYLNWRDVNKATGLSEMHSAIYPSLYDARERFNQLANEFEK